MVFRSILVSTSMPKSSDLLDGPRECPVETAASNFIVLVRLNVSVQQNVKLGGILELLHCCSVIGAVVNVEGWLCLLYRIAR